jgi:hypothetical protein
LSIDPEADKRFGWWLLDWIGILHIKLRLKLIDGRVLCTTPFTKPSGTSKSNNHPKMRPNLRLLQIRQIPMMADDHFHNMSEPWLRSQCLALFS